MTDAAVIGADALRSHAQPFAMGRLLKARGFLAVVAPDVRLASGHAADPANTH
jgi:hypothetical protein